MKDEVVTILRCQKLYLTVSLFIKRNITKKIDLSPLKIEERYGISQLLRFIHQT